MSDGTSSTGPGGSASRRARHIEEAILEVDGVVAVRVWEDGGRVEIGVVASAADTPNDVLDRVRELVEAMRGPDEVWEVGVLNDHAISSVNALDPDATGSGR